MPGVQSGALPILAGPARRPLGRVSAGTAAGRGLADGDRFTVGGATGSISLPVRITPMPEQVVWLPMRSPGSEIRTALGTGPGGIVRLARTTVADAAGAPTDLAGELR